jgi:hypothetical protein
MNVRSRRAHDVVPSLARLALAAMVALISAPVAAHGLWRPMLVALDATGDARWVSVAALLVAAAAVIGHGRWPTRAPLRWGCAGAAAIAMALLVGGSGPGILAAGVALLAVACLVSATLPIVLERIPPEIDDPRATRGRRVATVAAVVLGAAAVIQTARLCTFIGDAERTEFAAVPALERFTLHACSSAYFHAAKLAAARVDNLYDASWWPAIDAGASAQAQAYAPFDLDTYAYPPPFLLLPRALLAISADFSAERALWFCINGLSLGFGLWLAATWIGERDGRAALRALLLAPLIWVAFPVLIALQVGNVHMAVIAAAIVGMIAFERRRPALGGALLSFAILAKISPGLLGVVLLVQKRWREALWTAGFGLGWSALALLAFGPAPFEAFLRYELPRLSSGEALAFFTASVTDVAVNMAPFGLPFKLEALGVGFDDVWASAASVSTLFTLLALALTIQAGLRAGDRRMRVGLWLAVLTLGSLRSPFAPAYVSFPALWLLSWWAAEIERRRGVVALALVSLLMLGVPPLPDVALLLVSIVTQTVLLAVVVWFIVRPIRSSAARA